MRALVIIDVQNDFLPGGALGVPGGDVVIPEINRLQREFSLIVATQDWHPADHLSFASNHPGKNLYDQITLNGLPQVLWPVHCVQNTTGAELAAGLDRSRIANVFQKGTDRALDSYSGFFDNAHRKSTGLGEWLRAKGVAEVSVCGLATDYCVKFSCLDAVSLGFKTDFLRRASRAVNLRPTDEAEAVADMSRAGVNVIE